ncbi:MAG: hypothetical protein BroJett012_06490 [Betaproteobacteria bacterium]|nr:MAG: hypothetical protein BroJett012_06490 [Betaproteobacteria bacterium]
MPRDTALRLTESLVAALPPGAPGLFNPWCDRCPQDAPGNGPHERLVRLANHLDCEPELILVGEAPGYQGCRYSGITFTSERLLLDGAIPRIQPPAGRLSLRGLPFSEPSATIVWKTLYRLGVAERCILWNALQMHPHKPGSIWTNRTPTDEELALGAPALRLLIEAFPAAKVVAVGRKAEALVSAMGAQVVAAVRHPANGGAREFSEGLQAVLQSQYKENDTHA